jgi:hypothetical protein
VIVPACDRAEHSHVEQAAASRIWRR